MKNWWQLRLALTERTKLEFKSTLRPNLHTGQPDDKIQLSVLKTIAGFLNAHGKVLGLAADGFWSISSVIEIGDIFLPYVHPHFEG